MIYLFISGEISILFHKSSLLHTNTTMFFSQNSLLVPVSIVTYSLNIFYIAKLQKLFPDDRYYEL